MREAVIVTSSRTPSAKRYKVSRESQDQYSLCSQQSTERAQADGTATAWESTWRSST